MISGKSFMESSVQRRPYSYLRMLSIEKHVQRAAPFDAPSLMERWSQDLWFVVLVKGD